MKKRDYALDVLKVIALIGIILAHVKPNGVIFQLRNFDVPLMIMISVWLSLNNIVNKKFKYNQYIFFRVKRLITPTWIFLTIYFVICFFLGNANSAKDILLSYSLIGGIGYVWVIRIYIYVAILTPIMYKIFKYLKRRQRIILVSLTYYVYILLVDKVNLMNGIVKVVLTASIIDFIGYSFIVYVAILLYNKDYKHIIKVGVLFGSVFWGLAIKNNFVPTQYFKYPIQLYYMAYAFFVSIFLYLSIDMLNKRNKLKEFKIINYISKNSMWIYLWHILYINKVNKLFMNTNVGYIYRLLLLLFLAVTTTYIQNLIKAIIKAIINKNNKQKINYKNKDKLLT